MRFDERKMKILSAIVETYIRTGEPVGSKAIMAHIKASSATIRNEMAELEKQGVKTELLGGLAIEPICKESSGSCSKYPLFGVFERNDACFPSDKHGHALKADLS